MATAALRAWLALVRAPGIGSRTLNPLLLENPDPETWFAGAVKRLPERLQRYLERPDWEAVDADLAWLAGAGDRHLVPLGHPAYPTLLSESADPPIALFVVGSLDVLAWPQIALVGSRNPTSGGARTAYEFARSFAAQGLAVTSGLALGIDGASHRGALAAQGLTLAVAGTGLDRVYPRRHRELAHQIRDCGGALVSEFPPGTPARAGHFPRRNRIISALSLGTLVIEAALQSGSLITARQALEEGREVFAIPGSIHSPLARGCHALIRQGAKLVECAEDVLEELGSRLGHSRQEYASQLAQPVERPALDAEHRQLLDAMGFDPSSIDQLAQRTGQSTEAVASMLLLLELEGHVSSSPGGLFSREGAPQT